MFAKAERMSIREFMKKDDRTTMKGTELKISDILERVNDPKVKRILATTTTIIVITKFGPLAALPAIAPNSNEDLHEHWGQLHKNIPDSSHLNHGHPLFLIPNHDEQAPGCNHNGGDRIR